MATALGNSKHLLHSDWLIDALNGASFRIKPPKKMGPVLAGGRGWEANWLGFYASVVQGNVDGYTNTMYYRTADWTPLSGTPYLFSAFAHSNGSTRWERPLWGYKYHRGRTHGDNALTNLLDVETEGYVFKDTNPGESSSRAFKKVIYDPLNGILPLRYSANGRSGWTNNGIRPISSVEVDTSNQLDFDIPRNTYVFRGRGWDTGATDDRFVVQFDIPAAGVMANWESSGYVLSGWKSARAGFATVFNTTKRVLGISHSNYDVYNPCFFRYNDTAQFMIPSVFDHAADLHNIHIAVSSDGVTWTWADGDGMTTPFIPRGETSSVYDCGAIYGVPGCIVEGDKVSLFYVATTATHSGVGVNPRLPAWRSMICRAELALDRFVVLYASSAATPLTKQITFTGSGLTVNCNGNGSLRIGLCDSGGTEIAGFRRADCTVITGDKTAQAVTWAGGSIAAYAGTTCRLRFEMSGMEVASIKFG